MIYCIKCGTQLPDDALFCQKCGCATDRGQSQQRSQQQSQQGAQYQAPQYQVPPYQGPYTSYQAPPYQQTSYQAPNQAPYQAPAEESTMKLIAKIFMIICCVVTGLYLIPLAWTVPMTVVYWNKVKNHQHVGTGFKVCTLLFVSIISGILMLCDNTPD